MDSDPTKFLKVIEQLCPTCQGSGIKRSPIIGEGEMQCQTCFGSGWQILRRERTLRIPNDPVVGAIGPNGRA